MGNVYLFIGFDRDGDPEFKLYSGDAGYGLEWIYLSEIIIKSEKEAKALELCNLMGVSSWYSDPVEEAENAGFKWNKDNNQWTY